MTIMHHIPGFLPTRSQQALQLVLHFSILTRLSSPFNLPSISPYYQLFLQQQISLHHNLLIHLDSRYPTSATTSITTCLASTVPLSLAADRIKQLHNLKFYGPSQRKTETASHVAVPQLKSVQCQRFCSTAAAFLI